MANTTTKIEWTDATWSPVTGCTKVSRGCKHCYAERLWPRLSAPGQPYAARRFTDVRCHPDRLRQPLSWRRPRRVFVNSMSDLFHEAIPMQFIAAVFGVMAAAERHTFQVLTKRPRRALRFFAWLASLPSSLPTGASLGKRSQSYSCACHAPLADEQRREMRLRPWPLPNVWLGVSVEDQRAADERIPLLLQCQAGVRFVSAEPLLGPLELRTLHFAGVTNVDALGGRHGVAQPLQGRCATLDWVIVGGESGRSARPMDPQWARSIRDQCRDTHVPFFMKQMAKREPIPSDLLVREYPGDHRKHLEGSR